MKKCGQCKEPKKQSDFSKRQFERSGGICRDCSRENTYKWREANPDKYKKYQDEYSKKYYDENVEKILEDKKEYYQENREYALQYAKDNYNSESKKIYNKKYYEENSEQIKDNVKIYYKNNKELVKEYHNMYYKERRANDINFKLKTSISASINFYLKSNGSSKNKKSMLKYLPYTVEELRGHLESLFESWMNWENHGKYDPKIWDDNDRSTWTWQIDHIIPHSTFKYLSMEDDEFKRCWALENLRPLSAKQNFLEGVSKVRHVV